MNIQAAIDMLPYFKGKETLTLPEPTTYSKETLTPEELVNYFAPKKINSDLGGFSPVPRELIPVNETLPIDTDRTELGGFNETSRKLLESILLGGFSPTDRDLINAGTLAGFNSSSPNNEDFIYRSSEDPIAKGGEIWYHGGVKGLEGDIVGGMVTKDRAEAQKFADEVGGVVYEVPNEAVIPAKQGDVNNDGQPLGNSYKNFGFIKPVKAGQNGWDAKLSPKEGTAKIIGSAKLKDYTLQELSDGTYQRLYPDGRVEKQPSKSLKDMVYPKGK